MTPLSMTVKVNLLTARLIRKVLLKKRERETEEKEKKDGHTKQNQKNIPTNEEVMRATLTLSSFPLFVFLKMPMNSNP